MKRPMIAIAAATLLVTGMGVAQAGPPWRVEDFWHGAPNSIKDRIAFTQARIDAGRRDHSLNPPEAERANRGLDNIRQWIGQMRYDDDSRLTRDQRERVQARLDDLARMIHSMRHNG